MFGGSLVEEKGAESNGDCISLPHVKLATIKLVSVDHFYACAMCKFFFSMNVVGLFWDQSRQTTPRESTVYRVTTKNQR